MSQSTRLDLTWSPDIQPFEDPQSYKVDIAAYILDPNEDKLERQLKMGKMLASNLPNTGKATVTLDGVRLQGGTVVAPIYVQVAVARTQDKKNELPTKACSWSAVTYYTKYTCLLYTSPSPRDS